MPTSVEESAEKAPPAAGGTQALNEVEVQVIDLFVSAVRMIGIPKSVAEIYGLLYVSPVPLPLDTLVERLNISKGSASQGLKLLRSFGAVKSVYVAGDRRDHYAAETELKKLASGFFREEVQPRMLSGESRLERLRHASESCQDAAQQEFYAGRIGKLAQWHARARDLLPLLTGMLE